MAAAFSGFSSRSTTRSANPADRPTSPQNSPSFRASPSAPTTVETTGIPAANASSSFTRTPEPLRIGQTNTAVARQRIAHIVDIPHHLQVRRKIGIGVRGRRIGSGQHQLGAWLPFQNQAAAPRAQTNPRRHDWDRAESCPRTAWSAARGRRVETRSARCRSRRAGRRATWAPDRGGRKAGNRDLPACTPAPGQMPAERRSS